MTDQIKTQEEKDLLKSNGMFLFIGLLFVSVSILLSFMDTPFKMYILITQYGVILLPSLVFLKLRNKNLKEVLKLKKVSVKTILKSTWIVIFALPIAYTLNYFMTYILVQLDWFVPQSLDLGTGPLNYLIIIFLMALTPGICEEVFFRGMILSGYEKVFDQKKVIFITGILFGIFHFEIQNLLLPAFLGIIFAWLVFTTKSIYPSMIGHALFNSIGVSLNYFSEGASEVDIARSTQVIKESGLLVLFMMIVISIISGLILKTVMASLKKDCLLPSRGDLLKINNTTFELVEESQEIYTVLKDEEVKRIKKSALKSYDYRWEITEKEKKHFPNSFSIMNVVFISGILLLFLALNILSRI
jgi:hypothetical protein